MKKVLNNFCCTTLCGVLLAVVQSANAGGLLLGSGVGIPYGGLGVRLAYDIDLGDALTVSPTAGGGAFVTVPGSNVGLQVFAGNVNSTFRPGFGVWNGTNTYVLNASGSDWSGSGVTVGFTPRLQFGASKRHVVDLNLLYVSSSTMNCPRGYVCQQLDDNRVKLGAGYSYRF